jgi:hypothetical protein
VAEFADAFAIAATNVPDRFLEGIGQNRNRLAVGITNEQRSIR